MGWKRRRRRLRGREGSRKGAGMERTWRTELIIREGRKKKKVHIKPLFVIGRNYRAQSRRTLRFTPVFILTYR